VTWPGLAGTSDRAVAIGAGMGGYLIIADSPALTEMRARNDALFGTARTAG
jgi:hypothetical protein